MSFYFLPCIIQLIEKAVLNEMLCIMSHIPKYKGLQLKLKTHASYRPGFNCNHISTGILMDLLFLNNTFQQGFQHNTLDLYSSIDYFKVKDNSMGH